MEIARPIRRIINGKRMVIVEEAEYLRLKQKADEWEPLLPEPNADGNYPAREYMLVSSARDIIRHRRRLGLTQVELARKAGTARLPCPPPLSRSRPNDEAA